MRLLILLPLLGLTACALLDRDPRSGYLDSGAIPGESARDLYVQRQKQNEMEAREELGLTSRTLSEDQASMVLNRMKLKRLEAGLKSESDKKQYFTVRSALGSDAERIRFLSLPGYESRARFVKARGLESPSEVVTPAHALLIETNDITLGMSQKAVTESWGDPDVVEIAGNPIYGYERWRYNRYVSGNEGYEKEQRVVYFEGGRVVGWERPK